MTAIIEENRARLIELCRKYHVLRLDVFGSAATGDFSDATSDIDLLVEFDGNVKAERFHNFFALREELQSLFGRPVDLVEPGGLRNPYFAKSVNETRKRVYATS
jgi:uncharacterized protein